MVRKEKENKSQMTVKRKIQKKLTRNEKMAKCKIIWMIEKYFCVTSICMSIDVNNQ